MESIKKLTSSNLAQAYEDIKKAKKLRDSSKAQINFLNNRLPDIDAKIGENENKLIKIDTEKEAYDFNIKTVEKDIIDLKEKEKLFQKEKHEVSSQFDVLLESKLNAEREREDKMKKAEDLEKKTQEIADEIKQIEENRKNIEEDLKRCNENLMKLEAEKNAEVQELDSINAEIARLQDEIKQASEKINALLEEIANLQAELNNMKEKLREMQVQLKQKIQKLKDLEQKLKENEHKIKLVNEIMNATELEKEKIRKEIEIAEKELVVS